MLFSLFYFLCSASANSIDSWLRQRPTPSNLASTMSQYGGLGTNFSTNVSPWLRRRISYLANSAHQQFMKGDCNPASYFKVFTADSVPFDVNKKEKQFINSIFRIESSYCINGTDLSTVYDTYMSPEYRLDVMPRLGQYTHNEKQTCIGIDPVPGVLKRSSYCLGVNTLKDESYIVSHSILKKATFSDSFQPLYYREEVLIIAQVNPNTIGIYRVTFTRSDDLGMASKFLIQSTLDSAEGSIYSGLERWVKMK